MSSDKSFMKPSPFQKSLKITSGKIVLLAGGKYDFGARTGPVGNENNTF